MIQSLLITLREGLEAALIVGILLGYLARIQQHERGRFVWHGVWSAIVVSVTVGAALFFTVGEFSGAGEKIFEGTAMIVAAGMLTWMIFWMRGKAKTIRQDLEAGVDSALVHDSSWPLFLLAFVAVVREGIETAVFLFAASREASAASVMLGSVAGFSISIAIGIALYRGIRVLDLKRLFQVTGTLLILFAAGVLAHGVHEYQEAGLLPIFVQEAWNTNDILSDKSQFGLILRAVFGYNGNPTLIEALSYFAYLVPALIYYFRPMQGAAHRTGESLTADGAS